MVRDYKTRSNNGSLDKCVVSFCVKLNGNDDDDDEVTLTEHATFPLGNPSPAHSVKYQWVIIRGALCRYPAANQNSLNAESVHTCDFEHLHFCYSLTGVCVCPRVPSLQCRRRGGGLGGGLHLCSAQSCTRGTGI